MNHIVIVTSHTIGYQIRRRRKKSSSCPLGVRISAIRLVCDGLSSMWWVIKSIMHLNRNVASMGEVKNNVEDLHPLYPLQQLYQYKVTLFFWHKFKNQYKVIYEHNSKDLYTIIHLCFVYTLKTTYSRSFKMSYTYMRLLCSP